MSDKLLIVLLADTATHENQGRALHAFLYAKQAKESGMEVELLFDGGGVEWIAEVTDEDHQMHDLYKELQNNGVIKGVCAFCSNAFDVLSVLEDSEVNLIDEDNGHPNIGKRMADGWRVLTI